MSPLNHQSELLECFYPQCSPLLTSFHLGFSEHPLSNRVFEAGADSRRLNHLGIKKNLNDKERRSATSYSAATSEENLHHTASARVPPSPNVCLHKHLLKQSLLSIKDNHVFPW